MTTTSIVGTGGWTATALAGGDGGWAIISAALSGDADGWAATASTFVSPCRMKGKPGDAVALVRPLRPRPRDEGALKPCVPLAE